MHTHALSFRSAPAFFYFLLLLAGIGIAHTGILSFKGWILAWLGGPILYGVVRLYGRKRLVSLRPLAYASVVCWMIVALGGARYSFSLLSSPFALAYYLPLVQEKDLTLEGSIDQLLTPSFRRRCILRTHRLRVDTLVVPVEGRVLAYLPPSYTDTLYEGMEISFHGRLTSLPHRRHPSDFNYGAYLFHTHIQARFYADSLSPRLNAPGPSSRVHRMRSELYRVLRFTLPDPSVQALYTALFLGDRSGLSREVQEHFRTTGLSHLLAISGLHLLLLGFTVYHLLRILLLRIGFSWIWAERLRALLTFLLLLTYVWISGGSESAIRALIMTAFFLLSPLLQRDIHPLHALGMAGILLLLLDPHALFRMGFQLSFAAVTALLLLGPMLQRILSFLPTFLRRSLAASLTVTAGTLPILLYHTGRVYLAGLVLNLVSIPLMSAILIAILPVLAFFPFWKEGALLYGQTASLLGSTLLALVDAGAHKLGWLYLDISLHRLLPWLPLGGLFSVFLFWKHPHIRTHCLLLTAGAMLFLTGPHLLQQPPLRVFFLDVGQGDATLIRFPDKTALLIDTGPLREEQDPDCGHLIPFLQWADVNQLNAVILTHPHADHAGALPCLLQTIPVKQIVTNGQILDTPLMHQIDRISDSLYIPVVTALQGTTLLHTPSTRLYVLHPKHRPLPCEDPNAGSLTLLLVYGRTRWLFTGDIGEEEEQTILQRFSSLFPVDVVKIPHHGSATSSSPSFVAHSTGPHAWGLVGVGIRNRYGLPDAEVLQRWQDRGVHVLQTAREGTIWLESRGEKIHRINWQSAGDKHRYIRIPNKGVGRGTKRDF